MEAWGRVDTGRKGHEIAREALSFACILGAVCVLSIFLGCLKVHCLLDMALSRKA